MKTLDQIISELPIEEQIQHQSQFATFKKKEMEAQLHTFTSNLREEDEEQFIAEMIHLDFMYLVKERMQELGISKTELAKRLGTSKGYISQLFSGDKLVNLVMIAKLGLVLGLRFEISVKQP